MVPLAVTSTNAMVRRLGGKRWNLLHRAVYPAAAAGVLHYFLLVKVDTRIPIAFAVALGILLGYRLSIWLYRMYQTNQKRRPGVGNQA